MLLQQFPGIDYQNILKSMTLFSEWVMPRFDPDGVDYIDIINSSNLERRPNTWVEKTELNLHHLVE